MAAAAPAAAPPNPITTPMTYQQLQDLAQQQAAASIAGQNAPLQAQVTTLGGQETAARGNIAQEASALLPYAQQSAQAVQQANDNALSMEQQVFAAAGTRMNQLHQAAASEAQQLAQQMGGPVSTGQFTQALEPFEEALPNVQAGGTLNALGLSMAGTQEAQQFAGQVFPAMMSEESAKSDAFFNDQIKTLNNQIDANAGTKSDLVNSDLNTLLQSERQFRLSTITNQRDAKAAAMNEKVQRQGLADDKIRNQLSQGAAKRAGIALGVSEQRAQASITHMTNQDRIQAQKLGLSVAEFKQRAAHQAQTAKEGAARVSDSISKDAVTMIQAAMGGGKPVSMTHRAYVPGSASAFKVPAGAFYDPQRKQYYKVVHETIPASQWSQMTGRGPAGVHPITDPNGLYEYMRGSLPELGRQKTINLIRAQTNKPNWSPGQKVSYSSNDLHNMPLSELSGLARDNGYAGKLGKMANRQRIVDYLMHVTPTPNPRAGQQPPSIFKP
jgi:hypothetical protein